MRVQLTRIDDAVEEADDEQQVSEDYVSEELVVNELAPVVDYGEDGDIGLAGKDLMVEVRRNPSRLTKSEKEHQLKADILSGIETGLTLRNVSGKGLGVFPTRPFYKGEFICSYYAELLTKEEGLEREKFYGPRSSCYLYFAKYQGKYIW